MKILITGGAGFIGGHTADLLLQHGHEVRVIDSLEPPVHPQRVKPSHLRSDVEFILGDVRDKTEMEKALRDIDVVFHLAAYQDYLTNFSRFAFVNDGGTALLYEIIVNNRLPIQKVIVASSQAVYGEGKYWCNSDGNQYPSPRSLKALSSGEWNPQCPVCGQDMIPIRTDESRVNPHNQYAISKYCQELYALNLGQRYDIPTVMMRYSITQGPRQSFFNAYSGVLRIFTLRMLNGLPPIIYEDGQQLRDYVYVGDVAKANLLVMESDAANYEVFNVGGDKSYTVLEYANLLIRLMGKDMEPEIGGKFRFGDTRHMISDIAKLQKLGLSPEIPVEHIAREYVDWVLSQPAIPPYHIEAEEVMRKNGVVRDVERVFAA